MYYKKDKYSEIRCKVWHNYGVNESFFVIIISIDYFTNISQHICMYL